jgi:hypothetical protein
MTQTAEGARRELEWPRREVADAAGLDDAERIQILEDLWQTSEVIRANKSEDQLQREEQARRLLDAPGRERYRALAERLA